MLWLILKWWYPSFSKYKYASKHLLLSRPDDTSSFTLTRLSPPLALDNLLVNLHHSPWTTYPSISTTRPGPPTRQSPPLALDHLPVNLHHSPWTTYFLAVLLQRFQTHTFLAILFQSMEVLYQSMEAAGYKNNAEFQYKRKYTILRKIIEIYV